MTPQEAHSDYLELLASGGVIGFAIGVWFVLTVFRLARANLQTPSRTRNAMCLGAVLGISGAALHSMFDFGLHLMANALVFAVLLTIATANVKSRNRSLKNALT
jgi:O-antigen ligase